MCSFLLHFAQHPMSRTPMGSRWIWIVLGNPEFCLVKRAFCRKQAAGRRLRLPNAVQHQQGAVDSLRILAMRASP
jgi:hypothetical protein